MAPELLSGAKYGENVDLWSVGAIINEMVTGRKLYDVKTLAQLKKASKKNNPSVILAPSVSCRGGPCTCRRCNYFSISATALWKIHIQRFFKVSISFDS